MPTAEQQRQLGIVTSPDDELQFSARHRPAMSPGDYTALVTQTLKIAGGVRTFHSESSAFAVFAPRFVLHDVDVEAVFPPAGASGQFGGVLPHVILNRPTLPWERTCESGSTGPDARPWLALLMFSDVELDGGVKQVKIADLLAPPPAGSARFARLDPETGDSGVESATVIDVPWRVLRQLLPAVDPDETSLVCHVRSVKYTDRASTLTSSKERSVMIANRLPEQGKRILVHLVSLENCYEGSPLRFLGGPPSDTDTVRLISLFSWQFFCQADAVDDFEARMNVLKSNTTGLRLSSASVTGAGAAKQEAAAFLDSGFVPLPHKFRQGDASISWYHGPFLPGKSPAPSDLASALPAITADQLLLYNSEQGMLDASYAAAWELGCLLMLENSAISGALFDFRRAAAQAQIAKQRFDSQPHALHSLPPQPAPPVPPSVPDWIANHLGLFEGLPFNYLVPDEGYLPPETLRFFTIDQVWRQCLIDGALSIGRFAGNTAAADSLLQANLPQASSGFLLRSAVVSSFPGMLIDGYPDTPPAGRMQPAQRLRILRREALAPNILLVIFEGNLKTVDFHLSPESIHFGVDHPDNAGIIRKILRSPTRAPAVDVPFRLQDMKKVIDMRTLAGRILLAKRGTAPSDSDLPEFALEMIESVPVFRMQL